MMLHVGKKRMLRAVGLLAFLAALSLEFYRETPDAEEGVGGGGSNISSFIRGGSDSGGGGLATEMQLEASAVTERINAADYADRSEEQVKGDVTGDKADDNDAEANDTELDEAAIIAPLIEESVSTDRKNILISNSNEEDKELANPVEQIILLGERHSGTEIADHLAECFDIKVSVHPRVDFC